VSARWIPVLAAHSACRCPNRFSALTRQGSPADPGEACVPLLQLLDRPIRSLVELTASMGVSRKLLWGNVGSAINGAAVMITGDPGQGSPAKTARGQFRGSRIPELACSYRGQSGHRLPAAKLLPHLPHSQRRITRILRRLHTQRAESAAATSVKRDLNIPAAVHTALTAQFCGRYGRRGP